MPLAMPGTYDETQLKLYQAAVSLRPEDIQNTRQLLWSIDRKSLTPQDRDLMDAAYIVLNHVRDWPEPPRGVIGEFGAYAILPAPADASWSKPVMRQAERLLKQTEDLMNKQKGGSDHGHDCSHGGGASSSFTRRSQQGRYAGGGRQWLLRSHAQDEPKGRQAGKGR
ncbi:hypothetical protein V6L77_14360 [Pannonibacter sp. Pt2-lr]